MLRVMLLKSMEIYRLWKDPKHISSYIVTLYLQSILSKYGIHINFVKIQKPDVGHNFDILFVLDIVHHVVFLIS